jgi:hypothetical protein
MERQAGLEPAFSAPTTDNWVETRTGYWRNYSSRTQLRTPGAFILRSRQSGQNDPLTDGPSGGASSALTQNSWPSTPQTATQSPDFGLSICKVHKGIANPLAYYHVGLGCNAMNFHPIDVNEITNDVANMSTLDTKIIKLDGLHLIGHEFVEDPTNLGALARVFLDWRANLDTLRLSNGVDTHWISLWRP